MTISTIPDYLADRQSAVPQADRPAFNARLDAVVKAFGADWLGRDHDNPVRGRLIPIRLEVRRRGVQGRTSAEF